MSVTNIHEAKSQLSKLIKRAAEGEEIIIAKAGEPVAKIVPIKKKKREKTRRLGFWKGKVWIAPDFDETPEEIMKYFRDPQ